MPRIRTPVRTAFVSFALLALSMVGSLANSATGFWSLEPIEASGIASGHNGTSIALDALGEPRVAFYEGTKRDLEEHGIVAERHPQLAHRAIDVDPELVTCVADVQGDDSPPCSVGCSV